MLYSASVLAVYGEWNHHSFVKGESMTKYKRSPDGDNNGHRIFTTDLGLRMYSLSSIMEFDHVIRVNPDGSIEDSPYIPDMHAPELADGELHFHKIWHDDDSIETVAWTLVGKSSQQGGGQVMHNSEFIGGGLADEILETPGYYVAIVCNWSCTHGPDETSVDDCDEDHAEGWAVAYRPLTS